MGFHYLASPTGQTLRPQHPYSSPVYRVIINSNHITGVPGTQSLVHDFYTYSYRNGSLDQVATDVIILLFREARDHYTWNERLQHNGTRTNRTNRKLYLNLGQILSEAIDCPQTLTTHPIRSAAWRDSMKSAVPDLNARQLREKHAARS